MQSHVTEVWFTFKLDVCENPGTEKRNIGKWIKTLSPQL